MNLQEALHKVVRDAGGTELLCYPWRARLRPNAVTSNLEHYQEPFRFPDAPGILSNTLK